MTKSQIKGPDRRFKIQIIEKKEITFSKHPVRRKIKLEIQFTENLDMIQTRFAKNPLLNN